MAQQDEQRKISPETATKNKRLAIVLGLVAVGIYVVFILRHMGG